MAATHPGCRGSVLGKRQHPPPQPWYKPTAFLQEDGAVGRLCLGSLQHVEMSPAPTSTWKSSLPASSQQVLWLCSSRLLAPARGRHPFTLAENPTRCVISPSRFVTAVKN